MGREQLLFDELSITSLAPRIAEALEIKKYALLKAPITTLASDEERVAVLLLCIGLLGKALGEKSLGFRLLVGSVDAAVLPAHVETIYAPTGPCRVFALGCVKAADRGGETRLFDAHQAAVLLLKEHPELAAVEIEYTTGAYAGNVARYRLVSEDSQGRPVLRYRAKVPTNRVVNHTNPDEMYAAVDAVLERCVLLSHAWEEGDILFVNNDATLHDRLPYEGVRKMVRVRFGDPNHTTIRY